MWYWILKVLNHHTLYSLGAKLYFELKCLVAVMFNGTRVGIYFGIEDMNLTIFIIALMFSAAHAKWIKSPVGRYSDRCTHFQRHHLIFWIKNLRATVQVWIVIKFNLRSVFIGSLQKLLVATITVLVTDKIIVHYFLFFTIIVFEWISVCS